MRTWTGRVHGYAGLILLYVVSMLALTAAVTIGGFNVWAAEAARFGFGVIGLVAAVRAARLRDVPPRLRQAWGAVAACFAILVVSVPALLALDLNDSSTADDVTHVVFVTALFVALQLFPLARTNRRGRIKAALDALIVLAGGCMVLWYTAFDPLLHSGRLTVDTTVSAVIYPIADLALLFSVSRALLRGAEASSRHPLRLLTAGSLVLFLGDVVHGYLNAHDATPHSTWQYFCWITTDALLAAAAVAQGRRRAGAGPELRPGFRIARVLPFGAVAVAHLLTLDAAITSGTFSPWGGLALGGAALSVLVLVRQNLVQRESDEQALTDGMTGLANRVRLRAVSGQALARGARTGLHSAVLVLDMNGFKQVNDTLGHKAGDRVLIEFAEVLRRCVASPGLPARLGGDEFAVVLCDLAGPRDAYEVAGRIAAALGPVAVEGRLITLAASIGVAVSAPGELSHDELVHRADLAMYRAKSLGPQTRWAVWQESLEEAA